MDYETKMRNEIHHYAEVESLHAEALPDFLSYWSELWRPIIEAAGFRTDENMFLTSLRSQCLLKPNRTVKVVSFGTGTCDNEIEITNALVQEGITNFTIECVEFNPVLCDQVRALLMANGLDRYLTITTQDINFWKPNDRYDMVMAAWCLHHFVELEYIFDQIHESLADDGVFVTAESMGRNGHVRWDEVWPILTPIWNNLPEKYKYNNQLGSWDIASPWDDDCAAGSFEGVRAQDILPLLMERFYFHQFAPLANLAEKFFEKNYGPNYDKSSPADCAVAKNIADLDELLIGLGVITPCRMSVVMGKQPIANPKYYKHWTPAWVVRDPEQRIHDVASRRTFALKGASTASTSVLMVVKNDLAATLTALESVRRNTPTGTEIVIVDNGSSDGTGSYLTDYLKDVIVVPVAASLANAVAWERGLTSCTGSTVIFLTNDIRLQEGWLDEPLRRTQADPNVVLSSLIVDAQGMRNASASFDGITGVCLVGNRKALVANADIKAGLCTPSLVALATPQLATAF